MSFADIKPGESFAFNYEGWVKIDTETAYNKLTKYFTGEEMPVHFQPETKVGLICPTT